MQPAEAIWSAAGTPGSPAVTITGDAALPSAFDVTGLAAAAIGAAGAAMAEFIAATTPHRPAVTVDRRLASLWLSSSIQPIGWTLAPAWDAVAGDYRAADGWIRLHTNAPHHREAALAVLDVDADRSAVAAAVARWQADALEAAIVTGYILATAALRALTLRTQTGTATTARASLAKTATLLSLQSPLPAGEGWVRAHTANDHSPTQEPTAWGPAHRLRSPLIIERAPMHWRHPAGPLRTSEPSWLDR